MAAPSTAARTTTNYDRFYGTVMEKVGSELRGCRLRREHLALVLQPDGEDLEDRRPGLHHELQLDEELVGQKPSQAWTN